MPNSNTTLHQINLHKSPLANFELFKQVEPLSNFVVLTQEPHVGRGKITGLPRGLKSHLLGPNSRSCIIWPKKLNISPITDFCTDDVVTCLWEINSTRRTKIMLISVYWDITYEGVPDKLVACIDYCKTHNLPYLCSMDSNAHSTLWGCTSDNPRGRTLEEFIIQAGADILNLGTAPTFSNHRYSTIIDITFSDPSLSPSLSNWRIHDTPSLSDHVAIRVDLSFNPPLLLPHECGKLLIGFSSNPLSTTCPLFPPFGMKLLLKQNALSSMNLSTKPLTYAVPNKLSNLTTNHPGGTSLLINRDGMPTGLTHTSAKTLLNLTKPYSSEPDALTSASAERLGERAGSTLSLAPTLKKMLPYSPKLCNTKSIPLP